MRLDRNAIVTGALALARREGLGAVGVRAVAAELGVTPMALYRYVDDATALEAATVAALLADLPAVPDGRWEERCRTWAHGTRNALSQAEGLPAHVLRHWVHLPPVLRALEDLVAMLEADGPVGIDVVAAANALLMHALMRAQADQEVRSAGVRRDLTTMRSMREQLPALWAHREEYRIARLDAHFVYGLDALLAGIGASGTAT